MAFTFQLATDSLGLGKLTEAISNKADRMEARKLETDNALKATQASEEGRTKRIQFLSSLGIMACIALVLLALIRR